MFHQNQNASVSLLCKMILLISLLLLFQQTITTALLINPRHNHNDRCNVAVGQCLLNPSSSVLESDSSRSSSPPSLLGGIPDGFYIIQQYPVPPMFDLSVLRDTKKERVDLKADNVTVPVALMLLDPLSYPSLSRARKACRQKLIVIERRGGGSGGRLLSLGRVGDRVYPGDTVCLQERQSHGSYSAFLCSAVAKPTFDLPVVYEDDHLAVVNKPAGILCYGQGKKGRLNVKFALPYVLKPPPPPPQNKATNAGSTEEEEEDMLLLRRPQLCHRLDKPTSGLLLIAKTKAASVNIGKQFEQRCVQKTYVAILNGKPKEHNDKSVSSLEAYQQWGVDVDPSSTDRWQIAETLIDDKIAITAWRSLRYQRSTNAKDGCLTLVELKPKTGRYHQLRRQMAWTYGCPIIGDTLYDDGTTNTAAAATTSSSFDNGNDNVKKKILFGQGRGLMLCSNRVTFAHPYYNTKKGLQEWHDGDKNNNHHNTKHDSNKTLRFLNGRVVVAASIDPPPKFESFLRAEEKTYLASLG